MFQLTAVFNKQNLQDVLQELFEAHIEGITVTDVVGKGNYNVLNDDGVPADLYEKVRVDIVISNEEYLEIAQECIRENCQDLGYGAGKMWWTPILGVERIRTGEKNIDALTKSFTTPKKKPSDMIVTTNYDTPSS